MQTNGRKIVKDLIIHRSLWQAVMSDDIYFEQGHPIKLRDVETLNSGNICISIKKGNKDSFQKVAENWNPVAMQFLPVNNGEADDLVVELSFY